MPGIENRLTAWGTRPESEIMETPHDALVQAQLDWTVSARDLYMVDSADNNVATPFRAIVNDKTEHVYGSCRGRYSTFQNWEVAGFCETVADLYGKPMVVSAGSLDKGAKMFMVLKLTEMECDFRFLTGDEAIGGYLLVRNTHDGSGALTAEPMFVRYFCTNQHPALKAARSLGKGFVSIRHTTNMDQRVQDAAESLGIVTKHAKEMDEIAARMANMRIERDEIDTIINTLIPIPELRGQDKAHDRQDALRRNVFGSATLGDSRGSRWGALQGITEFFQHEDDARFKSSTPLAERRMLNNTTGVAARAGRTAWDLLAV